MAPRLTKKRKKKKGTRYSRYGRASARQKRARQNTRTSKGTKSTRSARTARERAKSRQGKNNPQGRYSQSPTLLSKTPHTTINRALAMYLVMLSWKTCKNCYETDELPNPQANPTQGKIKKRRLGHFFPCEQNIFSWVGIGFI